MSEPGEASVLQGLPVSLAVALPVYFQAWSRPELDLHRSHAHFHALWLVTALWVTLRVPHLSAVSGAGCELL